MPAHELAQKKGGPTHGSSERLREYSGSVPAQRGCTTQGVATARIQPPALAALGLGIALALAGCIGPPAPPAPSPSSSAPAQTTTPPPSSAPATTPPPSSETSKANSLLDQVAPLTIYYVAIGDNGASGPLIGCGDSLVATHTAPFRFTDQVGPSIRTLLANRSRTVGMSGLVNVLSQSTLSYVGGSFDGTTITIFLTGQFMLAGECDIPRAKAQLEFTAMTAAGATRAAVFVNGRPIDDVLSLR